ncbi:MAG: response regulator [Nitrospiraceae bacterium]|nr:response regulator [Nitrospiraceae bacterium]MDA8434171.1 response regulator [Nitrospiraceae bacterium]
MAEKILVVDDEPLILTAVERALAKVGYFITRAQTMEELGEVLKDGPFDLLITDVYMQGGSLDEVIEKVRRTSPSIKVLKMSGAISGGKAGHFIEKPFNIEALREKVKDILNGSF